MGFDKEGLGFSLGGDCLVREDSARSGLGDNRGVLEGFLIGDMSWEVRRRLRGEYVTVAEILGGGVDEFGRGDCDGGGDDGGEVDVVEEDGFGLGAKKREIACCFCFPMTVAVRRRYRIFCLRILE